MVDTTAETVLRSNGPAPDQEVVTFLVRYPKFVHAEHMRHRSGSYCVSSSRAIPVTRNLTEVRSDELRAGPVFWGAEQRGMSPAEELSDELSEDPFVATDGALLSPRGAAKQVWKQHVLRSADEAEAMMKLGAHKSIVNRMIEDGLHVNVLVTTCRPGLLNFFGLRLDRAAQAEIRAVAEAMWATWNETTPQQLMPGQWHTPFIDDETSDLISAACIGEHAETGVTPDPWALARRVSAARCARLTYLSYETGKRSTISEDEALCDKLLGASPVHASPSEHQATPDVPMTRFDPTLRDGTEDEAAWREFCYRMNWRQPHLHGNLPGWVQHRKLLPGEAVAPLPEGYR